MSHACVTHKSHTRITHTQACACLRHRSRACIGRHVVLPFQGTGRYAIYIANYASGDVGPHALIEMDEAASDLSQGVVALSNVAEQAGVNKLTGGWLGEVRDACGGVM